MYEPKDYFIVCQVADEKRICEDNLTEEEADRLMREVYYPAMDERPQDPVYYYIAKIV